MLAVIILLCRLISPFVIDRCKTEFDVVCIRVSILGWVRGWVGAMFDDRFVYVNNGVFIVVP